MTGDGTVRRQDRDDAHPPDRAALEANKAISPPVRFDKTTVGPVTDDLALVAERLSGRLGWTYNLKTKTGLDASASNKDCKAMYCDLIATTPSLEYGRPIYLVAITNGSNTIGDKLIAGYNKIANEISETPLIGYWRAYDGTEQYDAAYPAQFESEEDAKRVSRKYDQRALFVIYPDGSWAEMWVENP